MNDDNEISGVRMRLEEQNKNPVGKFTVREIRFIVGAEECDVYVFVDTTGPVDEKMPGWHCKRFPTTKPFKEIYDEMCRDDSPLMWPNKTPVPNKLTLCCDLERIKI